MNDKDLKFLQYVEDYVTENTEVAPYVTEFVAKGIERKLKLTQLRACDMECALATAVSKTMAKRKRIPFILEKIKTWSGRASLDWKSTIAELEAKQMKEYGTLEV